MGAASHRRRRGERGAAAVEFALISTGFCVLVFGMIDYGFYLNDSLSVRQTVRQAARVGVVDFGYPTSCTGSRSEKTACAAKTLSTARTGATYVKVSAPEGWVKGKPLVVCSIVNGKGIVGLVPLPQGARFHRAPPWRSR